MPGLEQTGGALPGGLSPDGSNTDIKDSMGRQKTVTTSKANRVLGILLLCCAVYLAFSLIMAADASRLAAFPQILTGPGAALIAAFSWAAAFIPLWLTAAAAIAFVPGFRPAAIFALMSSFLPFIALAGCARFMADPSAWYAQYPWLETLGPVSFCIACGLLVLFLCLLIARLSLAIAARRAPSFDSAGFRNVPERRHPLLLGYQDEAAGRVRDTASAPQNRVDSRAGVRGNAGKGSTSKDAPSSDVPFSAELPELPPVPALNCLGGKAAGTQTVPAGSAGGARTASVSEAELNTDGSHRADSPNGAAAAQSGAPQRGTAASLPDASEKAIPLFFGHKAGASASDSGEESDEEPDELEPLSEEESADISAAAAGPARESSAGPEGAAAGAQTEPGADVVELRDGSTITYTSVPSGSSTGAGSIAKGAGAVLVPEGAAVSGDAQREAREKEAAKAAAVARILARKKKAPYVVPIEGILNSYPDGQYWIIDDKTRHSAEILRDTLAEFNIKAEVTGIRKGPVITMFEILPAPGIRLSKIANLSDNIALRLAASSVRIVAPIPGKQAVGIEVPNERRSIVSLRELVDNESFKNSKMEIPVILGKDISGEAQFIDLVQTPHLLIAGATGSGKSVLVNSIILSILFTRSPEQVRLILIDPKIVELKLYNDIGHLLTPVITEPKKAFQALQYCICEMDRRYSMLDRVGVRDIKSYNKKIKEKGLAQEKLPYIVVIIDEFADLMATTGKELESTLARLAAMSRAVGIHLVLATQRPSIDVITGLIKANIPSRIAFMVASKFDSRIIIDSVGAEKLLGRGDMLFASAWDPFPIRMQGAYVSEEEVERAVEYVRGLGEPEYIDDDIFIDDDEEEDAGPSLFEDDDYDPLYDQALQIVLQQGKASASYIQRKLKVGYNRAARLVELMEEKGIVGPAQGSKPRELVRNPEITGRMPATARGDGPAGDPGGSPLHSAGDLRSGGRQGGLLPNLETVPRQRVTGHDDPEPGDETEKPENNA